MTYALVLVKGKSTARRESLSLLDKLTQDKDFSEKNKVKIVKVFISFGWPDIIVVMRARNVELIKNAIILLREKLSKKGDCVDTSTIICTTSKELKSKKEEWGFVES